MPDQMTEAEDAIRRMDEARGRLYQDALDLFHSDDFKNQRDEARERYRRLKQKHDNLKAVIDLLRTCTIRWGQTEREAYGHTDKSTIPPTIVINETWKGIRDAVIAQILAHEAIHALSASRNSVDQEIRCRRKELEVWELLKGNERHPLDLPCENEQRAFAQGEDTVRSLVRAAYPGIPDHDDASPPPDPPKLPEKQRGRIRIERSEYLAPRLIGLLREYISHTFALIFRGVVTDREYCFDLEWPRGFSAQETVGLHEHFTGIIGTRESDSARGLQAVFTAIEAPDVIHGGSWASHEDHARYRLDVWRQFGSTLPGGNAEILQDVALEVDGYPAWCVEALYRTLLPGSGPEGEWLTLRERAVYIHVGPSLCSFSLICETREWEPRVGEFERALKSLRFR